MIAEASFIRTEGPEAAWRNAAGPEGLGQGQWEAPRVPAAQLCSHLDGVLVALPGSILGRWPQGPENSSDWVTPSSLTPVPPVT